MKQIQAYKCGFCGKVYQKKGTCLRHEEFCGHNPTNDFKCLNECANLVVDRIDGIKVFSCSKLNIDMHTHVAKRRNLECVERTEPMKIECDSYEYKYE